MLHFCWNIFCLFYVVYICRNYVACVPIQNDNHDNRCNPSCAIQVQKSLRCRMKRISALDTIQTALKLKSFGLMKYCLQVNALQHSPDIVPSHYQSILNESPGEISFVVFWNDTVYKDMTKFIIVLQMSSTNKECFSLSSNKAIETVTGKVEVQLMCLSSGYILKSVMILTDKTHTYGGRSMRQRRRIITKPILTLPPKPVSNVNVAYNGQQLRIVLSGHGSRTFRSAKLCSNPESEDNSYCHSSEWCLPLQDNVTYISQSYLSGNFFIKAFSMDCDELTHGGPDSSSEMFTFSQQDNFTAGGCIYHSDCTTWNKVTTMDVQQIPMESMIRVIMDGVDLCKYPVKTFEFSLIQNPLLTRCLDKAYETKTINPNRNQTTLQVDFLNIPPGNYCILVTARLNCDQRASSQYSSIKVLTEPTSDDPNDGKPNHGINTDENVALFGACGVGVAAAIGLFFVYFYLKNQRQQNTFSLQPEPVSKFNITSLMHQPPNKRLVVLLLHCAGIDLDVELISAFKEFLESCCFITVVLTTRVDVIVQYITEGHAAASHSIIQSHKKILLYLNNRAVKVMNEGQNSENFKEDDQFFLSCYDSLANQRLRGTAFNIYPVSCAMLHEETDPFVAKLGLSCEYNNLPHSLPDLFVALHNLEIPHGDNSWKNTLTELWKDQPIYTSFLEKINRWKKWQLTNVETKC